MAILQFEIDRKRVGSYPDDPNSMSTYKGIDYRVWSIIQSAASDTYQNGGTFVLVATADKITVVQRPDAEEIG